MAGPFFQGNSRNKGSCLGRGNRVGVFQEAGLGHPLRQAVLLLIADDQINPQGFHRLGIELRIAAGHHHRRLGIRPAHLPDNLAGFPGRGVGYGAGVKDVEIGYFARPHNPVAAAGKGAGHLFDFTNI